MPKLTTNLLGVSILALIFAPAVDAQVLTAEDSGNSIHWAYSAFFGTGAYRVGDEQDIFVIRVPPKWQVRTSDDEKFGIDLEFPVTVGVHNFDFDDILDDFVPTDLQQISVVPTVKLDMPMGPRWTLRPLASLGWGTELSGGESAWIYNAGLRSRVSFAPGRFELGLLNGLEWYGYTPDKGKSNDLSRLMTGLEVDHPMGKLQLGGDPLWLKTHVIHYWYFDELDFFFSDRRSSSSHESSRLPSPSARKRKSAYGGLAWIESV